MPKYKYKQFKMLIVFVPIFVVDTKIIYGYNFVAPLTAVKLRFKFLILGRNFLLKRLDGIIKQLLYNVNTSYFKFLCRNIVVSLSSVNIPFSGLRDTC